MQRRAFLTHLAAAFGGFALGLRRKEIVYITDPGERCKEPDARMSEEYWTRDQMEWSENGFYHCKECANWPQWSKPENAAWTEPELGQLRHHLNKIRFDKGLA